jgi:hypothetical protein
MENTDEVTEPVRYLMDVDGHPTATVTAIDVWARILDRLENDEDARLARERLADWRSKRGWTPWGAVEAERGSA